MSKLQTKSCEMDLVCTRILKKVPHVFGPVLTKIVNLSLSTGKFEDSWKAAPLHPLIKNMNGPTINQNYRPVRNLSFLSKLREKCVHDQYIDHCDKALLNPMYRSAYKQGHSCETALIKILNDLLWAMEHQQVSALILLDFTAIFDTVEHSVLTEVLNNKFGVIGTVLQWFKDYLTKRKFKVCINNNYSDKKDVSFLVPQGSINGPLLFNSYSSTIRDVIDTEMTVNAFADDHSLQKCFKPINESEPKTTELLESNLKKAGECMCQDRPKT